MGLAICTPTSITVTGTGSSASTNSNGSVTFTDATALILNGVFSATYDNYMVSIRSVDSNSTTPYMYLRLTSSGTPEQGANSYDSQYLEVSATTLSAVRNEGNSGLFGGSSSANRDGNTLYIFGPFLSEWTVWRGIGMFGENGGSILDAAGLHQVTTSYDGIQLTAAGGAITGLVTVYGFNQ